MQLVVIAASAGGLPAIAAVLRTLPGDFRLPIAIVQHIDPKHRSHIAEILRRHTRLSVKEAEAGDTLTPGTVYIAPPNVHLMIAAGHRLRLSDAAPVHYVRPSADLLFESAAALGPVLGIILSGAGSDGAVGGAAIRAAGGIVIAQDQGTSAFFGMPQAAIEAGAVDLVLPLESIGRIACELTRLPNE